MQTMANLTKLNGTESNVAQHGPVPMRDFSLSTSFGFDWWLDGNATNFNGLFISRLTEMWTNDTQGTLTCPIASIHP